MIALLNTLNCLPFGTVCLFFHVCLTVITPGWILQRFFPGCTILTIQSKYYYYLMALKNVCISLLWIACIFFPGFYNNHLCNNHFFNDSFFFFSFWIRNNICRSFFAWLQLLLLRIHLSKKWNHHDDIINPISKNGFIIIISCRMIEICRHFCSKYHYSTDCTFVSLCVQWKKKTHFFHTIFPSVDPTHSLSVSENSYRIFCFDAQFAYLVHIITSRPIYIVTCAPENILIREYFSTYNIQLGRVDSSLLAFSKYYSKWNNCLCNLFLQ